MDSLKISCVVLVFVVAVGFEMATALECVECNSHYDPYCENLPGDFKENEKTKSYITNCSTKADVGNPYTMCRKMEQTVEGEFRTIRMCAAHGKSGKCIERTGTKDIKLRYCICQGELCNTATAVTSKAVLVCLISALLAMIFH